MNFSYMQSLALCAAYITGVNKESSDLKLFEPTTRKKAQGAGNKGGKAAKKDNMVGKSKRFSLERYSAILDYFVST